MNIYPRESVEFQPVLVTLDGEPITTNVEFSITNMTNRPSTWSAATLLQDQIGVMISGLAVGTYKVWARITDSPEIPVIDCGSFAVS